MNDPVFPIGAAESSSARPLGAVPPKAQLGPQTVINPERRAAAVPAGAGAAPERAAGSDPATAGSSFKSSVVRLLFPADDEIAAQVFDAQSGVVLGHFTVIERIRTGGMGAVFRALDTRLSRVVALKVLPPALSRDPLIVQRFKNEAQAAAQLDHENVARVFFIGEDHGLNFIAFEFINGTNVRDLIAENTRLPVDESVNYILQIAAALVHTSAQGVVHRDIKPSNIIITPSGRAKLVDLGLARKESKDDQAADLTVAGTTLGTFDYLSPEQARDPRAADVRSDIYSLGCTLYHMLTGDPPYPEGTVLQKLLQHQGDEAPDPSLKNRLVPEGLAVVVRKMMAKDPRRRYQTPEQLVRDLMLVAGEMGLRSVSPEGLVWLASQPARTSFWERHLAWMVTAALLFVIVGYMEFGGWLYSPPPNAGFQSGLSRWDNRDALRRPATDASQPGAVSASGNSVSRDSGTKPKNPVPKGEHDASVADGMREAGRTAEEGDGPSIADGKRRPGDLDGTTEYDGALDPDESNTAFVPIPLTGVVRGNETGSSPGPRFDAPATAPGSQDSKSVVGLSGSSARAGTFAGQPAPPAGGKTESEEPADEEAPRPSSIERTTNVETAAAAPADDETYVILGRDNFPDRFFKTLEAACSSVRTDGAVIELRFSGRRRESAVRINRKVFIRAARGYRPVIEFRPNQTAADTYQVRAVWVPSGSLDVVGVDIVLSVDETVSADQWALFSLERADSLRLQGVTLTLQNPRQRSVAAIELRPGAGDRMPDMPVAGAQPKPPLKIEIVESLVRGDGDLFAVRHAEPARLAIEQSVVALSGTFLSARGNSELSNENAQLELRIDHVTAVLGDGLVRLDSGNAPRKLLPVQVSASNSIFSNCAATPLAGMPLVGMKGNSPPQDFHGLLFWMGQNNFYDRYQSYWTIVSTEGTGRSESWDSAAWRKNWTEASESNPRFDAVVWNKRQWMTRPLWELTAGDFSLDRLAANNPAVDGATNFSDAGANLAALPKPALAPADDRPQN